MLDEELDLPLKTIAVEALSLNKNPIPATVLAGLAPILTGLDDDEP